MKTAKKELENLDDDSKLLVYFFILVFIIWVIFDPIKYSWANDPFQKVVLAPLGEEPFKFLLAFILCCSPFVGDRLLAVFSRVFKKPLKMRKKKLRILRLSGSFPHGFVPFTIVSAIIFGISEGPMNNIILHFSMSSIGAILLVWTYQKVKNKNWKISHKVLAMFSTISIPMFLHSVSNQYSNISTANNKPEFGYLVTIARYLEDNTILSSQRQYVLVLFWIACFILIVYILKFGGIRWKKK